MARAPTTFDVFNAIAEVRRRQLLTALSHGPLSVTELTARMHWPQSTVSKHLAVLRQVDLVRVERQSRNKVYSMNAEPLKTVHEWTEFFASFWADRLQGIKSRAEAKARAAEIVARSSNSNKEKQS